MTFNSDANPTWSDVKAAYWRNHEQLVRAMARRAERSRGGESARDADQDGPDDDFWAWEYVNELSMRGDEEALERLVDLAESAPDDASLAYLGAGPVEDMVRVFGESLIETIEAAAAEFPNFRRALRGMYGTCIPESIRVRMLPLVPVTPAENRIRVSDGLTALPAEPR